MKIPFGKRLLRLLAILLPLIFIGAAAEPMPGFDYQPDRPLKQKIPPITLSDGDKTDLAAGKPVTRLVDVPGGLKAGYMRIFLPYDPPTIYRIVMDIHHFSMVSPEYPKNGSITDKRRTFMPYVFDSAVCEDEKYLYQLLVMPLVAPRQFTLNRYHNRDAFPWESKWSQEKTMHCQDHLNAEMDAFRKNAILTTRNEGCWHISPLPKEFVKSKADLLKTDCVYYVDSNPGGNLSSIMSVVNKATQTALPALADNLAFHAKRWDDHMKKHHTPQDYEEWKAEVEAYKKAVTSDK